MKSLGKIVEKEGRKMAKGLGKQEFTKVKNAAINTLNTEGHIVKNMAQQKLSQTLENKPSSQPKKSFKTGVTEKSDKIIKTVSNKVEMGPLGKAKRTIEEFINVIFLNKHGKYTSILSEKQKQLEFEIFKGTYINKSIDEIINDINNSIDISIEDIIQDIINNPELLKEYTSQKNKV